MWRQKIGNIVAGIVTTMFLMLAVIMVVSFIFFSSFLFTQIAWAADTLQGNDLCFSCHGAEGLSLNYQNKEISLTVDKDIYENSTHGKFTCNTCHTGTESFPHQIEYNADFKKQMGDSCNKCHASISEEFDNSVHGRLGGFVSCTSCHGSPHEILKSENPASNHNKANVSESCSSCHQGMVLESYERSFHGIALSYDYEKAPSCTDCHSSHNILPSSDSASTISETNIGNTCEPCHTGMSKAGANLLDGKQHAVHEDKVNAFPLWITWKIFLGLILFDVVMNGTIPTFELYRHFKNLKAKRKEALSRKDSKNTKS